jgi:sterol desaturase/sphingolipid hydroxylase (fatty acid hydroxylase superfamily)
MMLWACLPMFAFFVLVAAERVWPASNSPNSFTRADWAMNLIGFTMQGLLVPALGYWISTHILPQAFPHQAGTLHIGFLGAFLLNFIVIDFLYYLQHRAFHDVPFLWKLHAPHHCSPAVNVWATSRNALVTNLLFVYMFVNPVVGYLCDVPLGFFAAAMVTAALDLVRHANIYIDAPALRGIFILSQEHHRHHDATKPPANFGANLLIWDRLFGTCEIAESMPHIYGVPEAPSHLTQLFFPWRA